MASLTRPEQRVAAARLVMNGTVVSLDYPLHAFDPSLASRPPPEHTITSNHADHRDDYLDGFWLQASSHVDGLRHRRHHAHGFYGGVQDSRVTAQSPTLGVQRWADEPIVGRGILIDLARHRARAGDPIRHDQGEELSVGSLDRALESQGVEVHEGDIALIHTGWADWYLNLPRSQREALSRDRRCTGFRQSHETLAWFWDRGVALAASDTFALEVLPPVPGSPFGGTTDDGMMHQELLALLGLPIGELWKLDELASICQRDRRYESLVVVKPLNLTGGVGSPANAMAIR